MKRARRLTSLWNWLPTFRAVAEMEHVSRAAAALGVSPSAASRMIGLLEEDIGQPLFTRTGRRVRLNAAGDRLLAATRHAMRQVDESLAAIAGRQFVGPLLVASAEPITRAFLLPAIEQLRTEHPGLVPSLRVSRESEVPMQLLSGQLDVAFVRHALPRPGLTLEQIGSLEGGVYVGHGHPLFGARRCTIAKVLEHAFVLLEAEQSRAGRWWPPQHRRKVALTVEAVDVAAELCASGTYLAVLPNVVAERHRKSTGVKLERLALNIVRPTEVFAVWREQLELPGRAEAVVNAVRARFDALA